MALAIFLVYMIMAMLYESLRDPFIVMFSVPLAAIGVVLSLKLTNTPFSMQAYIGVIMLAGIVVNQSIVLIDAVNQARERGLWKGTYAGTNPGEYWAESVQDWYDAGQKFVRDARNLPPDNRRAMAPVKNVIFFVGDGMGVSTITATRATLASNASSTSRPGSRTCGRPRRRSSRSWPARPRSRTSSRSSPS